MIRWAVLLRVAGEEGGEVTTSEGGSKRACGSANGRADGLDEGQSGTRRRRQGTKPRRSHQLAMQSGSRDAPSEQ